MRPRSLKRLQKTEVLGTKQIDRYGKEVIAAINKAMQIPVKDLPKYPRKTAPHVPAVVAKRVKQLRAWRDDLARQLQIDPAIICTKALISAIAVQRPLTAGSLLKMKELKKWQATEFGSDIIEILKSVG
jgi:ribonuclease D